VFIAELRRDHDIRMKRASNLDAFLKDYIVHVNNRDLHAQSDFPSQDVFLDAMESVDRIHAQSGDITDNLARFMDWIDALDIDPLDGRCSTETQLFVYRSWVIMERQALREKNRDPALISAKTYTPEFATPRDWILLYVAYQKKQSCSASGFMKQCAEIVKMRMASVSVQVKEALTVIKNIFDSIIETIWTFVKEHPFLATTITAVLTATIYKVTKSSKRTDLTCDEGPTEVVVQPEGYPLSTPKTLPQARAVVLSKPTYEARPVAEMGMEQSLVDTTSVVARQQFYMQIIKDGESTNMGTITNVCGRVYMMPYHFYVVLTHIEPDEIVLTQVINNKVVIRKPYQGFIGGTVHYADDDTEPKDLCFLELNHMPRGRDISRHFCTIQDMPKLFERKFYAGLVGGTVVGKDKEFVMPISWGGTCELHTKQEDYSFASTDGSIKIASASLISYVIPTTSGECGRLLIANSSVIRGKVVGMHVSGCDKQNFAQAVPREQVLEALAMFPASALCSMSLPSTDMDADVPHIQSGFIHVGKLKENIPQSSRTTLRPSKLYGKIIDAQTRPALLRPKEINGELWDPLEEGAKKAGKTCGYVDPVLLDVATRDVILRLRERHVEEAPEVKVLDYETAIRGIPGSDLFQPINRTTSPGYPYILHKPAVGKGKTPWMGHDEYDFTSESALDLMHGVDDLIDACDKEEYREVYWIDTLKDERLAHAKVDIGKTRVISNGPMHYNIAFRKYFMGALAYIRHNRIYNGIGVGLNVWSREWDFLAQHMLANSPHMVDGDFAGYDGTIIDQVMWSVLDVLDSLYPKNERDSRIRRNLWYYACYALRVNQGRVYQCTHSLPSGFPATAEANSIYELLIFRVAYLSLAAKHNPAVADMKSFNQHVRMITYGDDNLLSISPLILEWYNMETLIEAMAAFGMTYTPADKTGEIFKYKKITEVSFLKRAFKRVDTVGGRILPIYTCPANLESRLDMLNWTKARKGDSGPEEAELITDVFQELAMHGAETYNTWTDLIARTAADQGIRGFTDYGFYYHHHKMLTGYKLLCDLAGPRQKCDVNKGTSNAIGVIGGAIQPYTLGSPGAALHQPRERHASD